MSNAPWQIQLFGVVTASRDGSVISTFRTQHTARVLARLAYTPDRLCRRDELIEMIWPDVDPSNARNRLNVALSALRRDLGSDILLPASCTGRSCVQLDKYRFTTDASCFESLLCEIDPLSSPEIQISQYGKALSLYTGELLAGIDDLWALGERQRASERFVSCIRSISKLLITEGRCREALDHVRRGTQFEPMREDLHGLLIRLLCGLGQRSEAVREHCALVHLLKHEYGISLSKKTLDLANLLLFDNPQVESGSHARQQPLSPVRRSNTRPDLSPDTDPLFGRDDCILDVSTLLRNTEARLVSLTGMGGTGKSRLAAAVYTALSDIYGDDRWFVHLADASDPQHIEHAILRKIGIRVDSRTNVHLQLVDVLSKRPALLILDNMEQLLPTGASVVMSLLDAVPRLKCLVTSRRRLNLSVEHERPVNPLQTPSKSSSPNSLIEFPSVQLFLHRAALASHGFEITRDNADCLAAICHQLEGLPLAIEMAAAWTRVMSPIEILNRLTPRLPLLVSRHLDAGDRHASVRRTLESSCDQMPLDLKRVFARLSVFRGGWSIAAAEVVGGSSTVLTDLMDLRDHSLLKVFVESDQLRISYLEIVREFAAEILQLSGEAGEVRTAHAEFFRGLAESGVPHLRGQHANQWLDVLDAEHDNLSEALRWSLGGECADSRASSSGVHLAVALWRYWLQRGNIVEGIEWMLRAKAMPGDIEPAVQAQLVLGLGILCTTAGDYAQAQTALQESIALTRAAGDTAGESEALNALGSLAFVLGDWNTASGHYTRALDLALQLADACIAGRILSNLANVAARVGDTDTAAGYFDRCLDILKSTSDTHTFTSVMVNSIPTLVMRNQLVEAEHRLARCIELSISNGYPRVLAHCFEGVAELSMRQARSRDAVVMFAAASSIRKRIGAPLPVSHRAAYQADYEKLRIILNSEVFDDAWKQGSLFSDDAAASWCTSRSSIQPERVPSR